MTANSIASAEESREAVALLRETMQAGAAYHRSGELLKAEHLYRQVLDIYPELPEGLYSLGAIACQTGHFVEAASLVRRAIVARPNEPSYHGLLGRILRSQGETEPAITAYTRAVELAPQRIEFAIGLALALKFAERYTEALATLQGAVKLDPRSLECWVNLGNLQRKTGDWTAAVASYERAIALNPAMAEAHNNLGAALLELRDATRARASLRHALELDPNYAEASYNLGRVAILDTSFEEAGRYFSAALAVRSDHADAHIGLGMVSANSGDMEKMVESFRRAIDIRPNDADTFFSFGGLLLGHGYYEVAAQAYEYGLNIRPQSIDALNNLGTIQSNLGKSADAVKTFRRLFDITPDFVPARINYANLLVVLGRVEEALDSHRRILATDPDDFEALGNLLLDYCYLSEDADALEKAHREWPQQLRRAWPQRGTNSNNPDPGRRLKVGFVSADLRSHSVSYFIEPLFEHLDAEAFEIHVYANSWVADAVTERLRKCAPAWVRIVNLSDHEVIHRIQEDEIDILVDLSGHTGGNRMKVFAAKPAPLQISYLGYPTVTGLPEMDYHLTDWQVDLADGDAAGEKPLRLANSYFCYRPLSDAPQVDPLPATRNGWTTFGSFNNLAKLSPATLALWKQLLSSSENSRLFLKCKGLDDPDTQERLRAEICDASIRPERLVLRAWDQSGDSHLRTYNEIDVGLDPFPYNGATTTCEALWMGVPVVTLAGATHPAAWAPASSRLPGCRN